MKYSMRLLLVVLVGVLGAQAQTDTLTILHINDTHSCLAPLAPRTATLEGTRGGIARAASAIYYYETTEPNAIALHAGDYSVGDMFYNVYFGVAELEMLKAIGIDAITVGNHEFDLYPSTLEMVLDTVASHGALLPMLSANAVLDSPGVEGLKKYISAYTVLDAGPIKVGVFGLTTPATNLLSFPSPAVISDDLAGAAVVCIDSLKSAGCDVIVLLSHLGMTLDLMLASDVPWIDIVVGGHDHILIDPPIEVANPSGRAAWIVQRDAFYQSIGKLKIAVGASGTSLVSYESVTLNGDWPEDPTVKAMADQLTAGIEQLYGIPFYSAKVTYADETLTELAEDVMSVGNHDTPVGNLVTDAMRGLTGTPIAITASGFTSQPIYEGPVTAADLFRAIGYGFNEANGLGYRLMTFKMRGADILTGLDSALTQCLVSDISPESDEFLIQVSGMTYKYDPDSAGVGFDIQAHVNGVPLDPEALYTITANEFIVGYLTLILQLEAQDLTFVGDTTEFHALYGYASVMDTLRSATEGRVRAEVVTNVAEDTPTYPSEYKLMNAYPNPFNPTTTISYSLPVASRVKLTVYNVLGQEVAVLKNGAETAGVKSATWNATVPSGVYFCRMEAAPESGAGKRFSAVIRLMIVK